MKTTLFNNWLSDKITSFLNTDGLTARREYEDHTLTSTIMATDSFGNRYEIKVTLIGRINTNDFNSIALKREYSLF